MAGSSSIAEDGLIARSAEPSSRAFLTCLWRNRCKSKSMVKSRKSNPIWPWPNCSPAMASVKGGLRWDQRRDRAAQPAWPPAHPARWSHRSGPAIGGG